ncbi:MATE family efflux transporter [Gorillibacterium sp. sgz5001074]|uniref:MATE family efflux transporter n=1 Tax=Gorillibacterium sp. sgz5001074 TaxID=3446695 RepID=UPI003F67142E
MTIDRKMSLWVLTWPIFLEMFLQFFLGTADTLMVSHISDDAVAVVGISNQLFSAVTILFASIASGAGILVAQRLGARKEGEARIIGIMGLNVSMAIGAVLSLLLYLYAAPVARLLQIEESLVPMASGYISVVGAGMVFLAAMSALGTAVRNTGNTRGPMVISLAMNAFHVGLNYAFIYGAFGFPEWGLAGVAVSTLISRFLGAAALFLLYRKAFMPHIGLRDLRLFDKPLFRETLRISWPLGINMSSWCLTQLVIFSIIAMLGTKELSARTYMNTMESFCFMIGYSIALAGQIRIAHLYGSGDREAAYRCAFQAMWIGLAVVGCNTVLLYAFGKPAFSLFTEDGQIISMGLSLLALNLLLQPAKMLNMALGNALIAVGDTRYIMITGLVSMWLVAAGLSYFLGIRLEWGMYGTYAAMILDEAIRGILVLIRWRSKPFMRERPAAVRGEETASLA